MYAFSRMIYSLPTNLLGNFGITSSSVFFFFLICHFQPFLKRHRVADRGAWLACGDNCRFFRRLAERGASIICQLCIWYSDVQMGFAIQHFFFFPFTLLLSLQMPRSDIIGGENVYNGCKYSSKGWWAYKHLRLNICFFCKKTPQTFCHIAVCVCVCVLLGEVRMTKECSPW